MLDIWVDDHCEVPELPDHPETVKIKLLIEANINFKPYVFCGDAFPVCDFDRPYKARQWLGPYTIKTTFYDRDFNKVDAPTRPGRYGAVVEVVPEQGPKVTRYRTLCCLPDDRSGYHRFANRPQISVSFPEHFGISPEVARWQSRWISEHLAELFAESTFRDPHSGAFFCGLLESQPSQAPSGMAESPYAADHQWWLTLKRKLCGMDKAYPHPFVCPTPISGAPAPILRDGSVKDAGMKPDAVEAIDAVCSAWAADSDEAFALCIARHGVVFMEKAYGMRDRTPMTTDTQSWVASITKTLSATLLWMLVDQGVVDLDDPVSKYLPPLRDIHIENSLTIRHVYTHTGGLWCHWGDEWNDLENVIALIYPYLEVARDYNYNGLGPALGSRVVEMITGEGLPQLYQNHLLGPLGCAHTDMHDSYGRGRSVPRDLAVIGQMLLNGGAYGDMRFFSQQTLDMMLPRNIGYILGRETDVVVGIGTDPLGTDGMSPRTFGHGSASKSTFRIDPENGLVVTMTRNDAGKNFQQYHAQFIQTIVENLQ